MTYELHLGSCLDILPTLESGSVDAIVTDPPYELGFMGKSWDSTGIAFNVDVWRECLRVLKSGGHLIAFSGSRTYHRMAVAIEDAGFEIRDQLMWLYGSGFPKSHNIAKALDKTDGVTAEQVKQWEGFGTALKPAHEPLVLARKPFTGTVAANVLTFGTGALNIDGTRIGNEILVNPSGGIPNGANNYATDKPRDRSVPPTVSVGRFPANVMHDGSDDVTNELGEAARFFYCAKASKSDREEGLEQTEGRELAAKGNGLARSCATCGASTLEGCDCPERTYVNPQRKNFHPTVKPTDLMRYLCRLITPPSGTVLDPFTGSGSTGKAAVLEGFHFVGIELDSEYYELAAARIEAADNKAWSVLF